MTHSFRSRCRAVAIATALGLTSMALFPASPASAETQNERFVRHLYEDFLSRQSSSGDLAYWSGQLGAGTARSTVIIGIAGSSEFRTRIARALYGGYLGREPSSSELSSAVSSLGTSGYRMFDLEKSLGAGAEFFTASGNTNEAFVANAYRIGVGRAASDSDLSYWTAALTSGTTRSTVMNGLLSSSEVAARRVGPSSVVRPICPYIKVSRWQDLQAGSYCVILKRPADSAGASYWAGQLDTDENLVLLWRRLAATAEYYARP